MPWLDEPLRAYWWPGYRPLCQMPNRIMVLHPTPDELLADTKALVREIGAAFDGDNIVVRHAAGVVNRRARKGGRVVRHAHGRVVLVAPPNGD